MSKTTAVSELGKEVRAQAPRAGQETQMNEKLAELRKMVGDILPTGVIRMVYLDEVGALRSVVLSIDGDEPTTDEWIMLREKAETQSFRAFEVLSMDGGRVLVDGNEFAEPVADNVLRGALAIGEENREYYFSSRRK